MSNKSAAVDFKVTIIVYKIGCNQIVQFHGLSPTVLFYLLSKVPVLHLGEESSIEQNFFKSPSECL